ncbi:unnamed protein product [Clonostachys solani]|uniref:Uncharacterized protein n=1 Tax=Clonostachys solani TaxID=160281 RepID=A0A9N9ZBQ2_9HYPO|nr:unnamed protein product [Clonostachys solani]
MKSAVALGLLVGAAVAKPHGHNHLHKRQVTVVETEVVEVTATILVAQDGSRETVAPAVQPTTDAKFFEVSTTSSPSSSAPPSTTSTSTSTSTSTTSTTSTTSSSSSIVIPSSTSTYVAPIPTTTSSIVIEVPTTTIAPIVVPTTTSQAPVPTTSASSGGGSGQVLSGDGTYFKIGLGSCGGTNYAGQDLSQPVVALAAAYYSDAAAKGINPCGKTVHITAKNGNTATGIVSDKCPECTIGSIDLSEMLFVQLFGDTGVGRGELSWTIDA